MKLGGCFILYHSPRICFMSTLLDAFTLGLVQFWVKNALASCTAMNLKEIALFEVILTI